MYKKLLLIATLFAIIGCKEVSSSKEKNSHADSLVQTHLGINFLDHVEATKSIAIYKVTPQFPSSYKIEKESVEMHPSDVQSIKEILSSDKSYLFNIKKKCPFLPEYALELRGEKEGMTLLYAPSCKELKRVHGELEAQIIEIDPSAEKIDTLIQKYQQQQGVKNE